MKEAFTFGDDAYEPEQNAPFTPGPEEPKRNCWPSKQPEFRGALMAYYLEVLAFSRKLMGLFALALDLPENYFDAATTFSMTAVRILHYPAQPTAESEDIGLGAHTDYDLFTLVCQHDVPALEVLNANGI